MEPNEEYATSGPFYRIFGNTIARVLDQVLIVGNMEQTISMLSESTNLSFKTIQKAVNRLINVGLMAHSRKIGNAKAFRFMVEKLHPLIEWITKYSFCYSGKNKGEPI